MKLWAGRFQKPTDELVNDFNASISFDQRLYKQDIAGSKAHAQMLSDCGILTKEDNEKIQAGLDSILADVEAGMLLKFHDILLCRSRANQNHSTKRSFGPNAWILEISYE